MFQPCPAAWSTPSFHASATIVISAGFDAHRLDPLANLKLSEADFGWATHKIMEIADLRSAGKVISVLEGGYALQSLASSVAAHVTALMES